MTQKGQVEQLIGLTLYKKQNWEAYGIVQDNEVQLIRATTEVDRGIITIHYPSATIDVNGHRQRISKELKNDLLTIVRLKIAKTLKHAKLN